MPPDFMLLFFLLRALLNMCKKNINNIKKHKNALKCNWENYSTHVLSFHNNSVLKWVA